MPPSFVLRSFTNTASSGEWGDVTELFVESFSAAPYFENEAELRKISDWGPAKLANGGRLVTARQDDQFLGFAFGLELSADEPWQRILSRLGDHRVATDALKSPNDAFVIQELAVRESSRGQGVARACVHELLRERAESRVFLGVYESAEDAASMYEHWGFEDIGQLSMAGGAITLHVLTATMAQTLDRLAPVGSRCAWGRAGKVLAAGGIEEDPDQYGRC